MNARRVWLLGGCAVLALGLIAFFVLRPPPPRRIAFLGMDSQMQRARVEALRDELAKKGYVEGKNLIVEYRWAEGRFDRLPELARELVATGPEVLVTAAPPSVRAAQQATSTIPIVMSVHDPIGMGFAKSLSHPGGNITGVAFQDSELSTRRLDLLRKVVPDLQRIAILWNEAGGGPNTPAEVGRAADAMGIASKVIEVRGPADIPVAVEAAKAWGAQAALQLASPMFTKNRTILLDAFAARRMPASCELREYVDEGCLMTYSADINKMFRSMGDITAQILGGAKASDIPIQQPREFDLVINMTTASKLGLSIPNAVLVETTERVR